MKSLRRQLTARLLVVSLLLSAMAGASVYGYARWTLTRQFDAVSEGRASAFTALVEIEPDGRLEVEFSGDSLPNYYQPAPVDFFELRRGDGSVLVRSPALGEGELVSRSMAEATRRSADLSLPNGRRGRMFVVRFSPRVEPPDGAAARPGAARAGAANAGEPFTLVLARDRSELDDTLLAVFTSLLLGGAALAIGVAVVMTAAIRRGLAPLNSVADRAATIDADSLNVRFPTSGIASELSAICFRFNELFDRVGESFRRERQFTANVAHELRTPITELRVLAEAALRRPDVSETARVDYQDALAIAVQMERVVTSLLALARCQSAEHAVSFETVDLKELIEQAWSRSVAARGRRDIEAGFDVAEGAILRTDRVLFEAVVDNLLSNAVEYTPAGGVITLQLEAGSDSPSPTLVIANTKGELEPEDLPRLCEVFWRKDPARSDHGHSGLGLSLVAAYAELLQIRLAMSITADRLLVVRLSLPPACDDRSALSPAAADRAGHSRAYACGSDPSPLPSDGEIDSASAPRPR